jgi:hypothetical protein
MDLIHMAKCPISVELMGFAGQVTGFASVEAMDVVS